MILKVGKKTEDPPKQALHLCIQIVLLESIPLQGPKHEMKGAMYQAFYHTSIVLLHLSIYGKNMET